VLVVGRFFKIVVKGTFHAMSVVLRAMNDLMKAQNEFKNDVNGQYMLSQTGERELIRGKLIYHDYFEKPSYYKHEVEKTSK